MDPYQVDPDMSRIFEVLGCPASGIYIIIDGTVMKDASKVSFS
tara:strand:+ start:159 stop:287 length:129 start_codon:yes stop_codon:yes gene_type:complete